MSASHRLIPVCLLLASLACSAGSGWAADPFPPDDTAARAFVERVFHARFESAADVAEVNRECTSALRSLREDNPNVSACPDLYHALEVVADCTSPDDAPGRKTVLFDFATSRDPGIARLRDEIGLPPPPGGVLVTVYDTAGALPEPLKRQLTGGHFWWGDLMPPLSRIIVLNATRLRASEARAAVSQKLAQAYFEECFGKQRHDPLVSGLVDYVLPESRLAQWRDWYSRRSLPADSPAILRYLEALRGAPALHRFLRSAATGPVEDALRNELGILDAGRLPADARNWETRANVRSAILTVLILLVLMTAALFALLRARNDTRRRILKYGLLPAGVVCLLALAMSHATRSGNRWMPEVASPPGSPELSHCSELAVRHWIRATRPGVDGAGEGEHMSLVREAVADELKRPVYDEGCRQFLRIASATWAGDPVKPDLVLLVSVCESELPGYAFRVVPAGSGYALSPFDSPRQSSDAEAFDKDSWTPGHNGWEEARAVDMDGDGRLEIVLAYVSGTHGYLTLDMMRKDRADGVWRRVWQEGILREGHWTMVPGKDAQPSIVLFSSDSGMLEHDPPRPYHYSEFVWDDTRGTMRWVRGADSDRPWNEDKWTRQAGIVLEGMQTSP